MMMDQSPFKTAEPGSTLDRWLDSVGLRADPFERWNAETDGDLSSYYVDVGDLDRLVNLTEPCVVLARRGCGKTAQRKMVAAQYRPANLASKWLAVLYDYAGFEQVLFAVDYDVTRVQAVHHVNALLQIGLTALEQEAHRDPAIASALGDPKTAVEWSVYAARFTPHLLTGTAGDDVDPLEGFSSSELLAGFSALTGLAGLEVCAILVDGVDEFPLTAGDPDKTARFLEPLLGTLALLEQPGLAFKFFLPQHMRPAMEMRGWFRDDRLHQIPITWSRQQIEEMLAQRMRHASLRDPPYVDIAQLCDDELAPAIKDELVRASGQEPRAALMLASRLLRVHGRQEKPGERIARATWDVVRAEWIASRRDAQALQPVPTEPQPLRTEPKKPIYFSEAGHPLLQVGEARQTVHLGERDVTSQIGMQDYRLLVSLYRGQGQVCAKDSLIEAAWPDANLVGVSDGALTQSIARLRSVIRNLAGEVTYIETIRGRGYRLHPGGIKLSGRCPRK